MTYPGASRFFSRVMVLLEVRMSERLFAGQPFSRIKAQETTEEVEGKWIRVREERLERHPRFDGQGTDVVLCLRDLSGESAN